MQAKFILAALGAASVAVATPVPGAVDRLICGNLLNKVIDALGTAVFDMAKANDGSPPATAGPILQTVQDLVDKVWETQNKALVLKIKNSEFVTATASLESVAAMLNGTDAGSVASLAEVTKIQAQFATIPDTCPMDTSA